MGNTKCREQHSLMEVDPRWSKAELQRLFTLYHVNASEKSKGRWDHETSISSWTMGHKKHKFLLDPLLNDLPCLELHYYVNLIVSKQLSRELSFGELTQFFRTMIYPEKYQWETWVLDNLLHSNHLQPLPNNHPSCIDEEIVALQHYLQFARLLYLYVFHLSPSDFLITSLRKGISKVDIKSPVLRSSASPSFDALQGFPTVAKSYQVFRRRHSSESSLKVLTEWCNASLPFLSPTFTAGMRHVVLKEHLDTTTEEVHNASHGATQETSQNIFLSTSRFLPEELHFLLNHATPALRKAPWICLYATSCHGRSINRLMQCVLYYPYVSIVAIKSQDDRILGGCLNSAWSMVEGQYFGNLETFLWTFTPEWNLFRPTGREDHFVYVNHKNQYKPKGIGFGGQIGNFRLWIDEDLKLGYLSEYDTTYDSGVVFSEESKNKTCPPTPFILDELEIWVEDNSEAIEEQNRLLKQDQRLLQQRRQVNPQRFFESDFDKEYLLKNDFKNKG